MTRVASVADVHVHNPAILGGARELGLNRRGQQIVSCLGFAVSEALEAGCSVFAVAGDLFDSPKTSPQMIAAVAERFATFTDEGGTVVVIRGNHDISSEAPGDSALAPFAFLDRVRVVDQPTGMRLACGAELLLIPFQAGDAITWIESALRALGGGAGSPRAAIVHAGVRDAQSARNPWAVAAPDAVDAELLRGAAADAGCQVVLAGNWHDRRVWDADGICPRVVQIGALCPTGWDNPGLAGYGSVEVWDTERPWETESIEVSGPRFLTRIPADKAPYNVYVRLVVSRDEAVAARAELSLAIEDGRVYDGLVQINGDDAGEVARAAVARVARVDSCEDAIARYFAADRRNISDRLRSRAEQKCLELLRGA